MFRADAYSWLRRARGPKVSSRRAGIIPELVIMRERQMAFQQVSHHRFAPEANIIHAAHRTGVEKLLFFGSSCIYPREAPQPIREEALLTGPLERTNEAYAIAKIAGIKLCQAYFLSNQGRLRETVIENVALPG
jgi:hypothetical protein